MSQAQPKLQTVASPLSLDNEDLYQRWRDRELGDYSQGLGDLLAEIKDPRTPTEREHQSLLARCRKANTVLYAGRTGADPDPEIPLAIGRRFGLQYLNRN